MRFIVIRKADDETEAAALPDQELLGAMMEYNGQLISNGVMLDGMGLQPTSKGARVVFAGDERVVVDGPFAEAKELIAGFTLIQARSKEEALEWVKRWPPEDGHGAVRLELRQVIEPEELGVG